MMYSWTLQWCKSCIWLSWKGTHVTHFFMIQDWGKSAIPNLGCLSKHHLVSGFTLLRCNQKTTLAHKGGRPPQESQEQVCWKRSTSTNQPKKLLSNRFLHYPDLCLLHLLNTHGRGHPTQLEAIKQATWKVNPKPIVASGEQSVFWWRLQNIETCYGWKKGACKAYVRAFTMNCHHQPRKKDPTCKCWFGI